MILFIEHQILTSGPDLAVCENRVRMFFEKSQLVHYDSIEVDQTLSTNAAEPEFDKRIDAAVNSNRKVLSDLMTKLEMEGCTDLQDILEIPQGFQSKLLHTMSHLLDGFFGIDSTFYDIEEMSHWITDDRRKQINESPETCWLIQVKAQLVYGQGFEKESD